MARRIGRWGVALLVYVLLAIGMTWPLATRWTTDLPGTAHKDGLEDVYQNVWNLWWTKQALLRPTNPFVTDRLFYPEHPSLYYHTLSPINTLLAAPVTALWGPIAAFNAVAFASFVLGALGMWWLARDRSGSSGAALMAAYGAQALLGGQRRPVAAAITFGLGALLVIDYLTAPILTRQPAVPPFLAALPHTDDGALLEYPFHVDLPYRDAERMLFQTVHGRPISGGYHSRPYPQPQLGLPALRDLAAGRVTSDIAAEPGGWPGALNTLGYRYIIGYKQQPLGPLNLGPSQADAFRAPVSAGLGVAGPDYEDAWLIAYRVPDAAPQPTVEIRAGWGAVEEPAPGRRYRWMGQTGELGLVVPAAGTYRLSWSALPAGGPRTITLALGGREVRLPIAGGERRYQVLLDLPAGATLLDLMAVEPATSGHVLQGNDDMRPISVRFADIALEQVRSR